MNNIHKVIKNQLDLPNAKLIYVIRLREYVIGIWQTLNAYGIPFTTENHEILVEAVQTKLEGPDIEREWTEDEYKNFVTYQPDVARLSLTT